MASWQGRAASNCGGLDQVHVFLSVMSFNCKTIFVCSRNYSGVFFFQFSLAFHTFMGPSKLPNSTFSRHHSELTSTYVSPSVSSLAVSRYLYLSLATLPTCHPFIPYHFQTRKQSQMSVRLSVCKTPQQLETIILHHSSFILHHPSSPFITLYHHSSSFIIIIHPSFISRLLSFSACFRRVNMRSSLA